MTDKTANLQNFINILTNLVNYVQENIPVVQEKAKIVGFKLEAAVDLAPINLAKEFVKKLQPYASQLINREEQFFLEYAKDIPIVKDINLELEWKNLDSKVKNELWTRVNSAFTFATLVSNEEAAATQQSFAKMPGFENIDTAQLGESVQKLMPAVLNMMGPLLGGPGGKKSRKGARDACNPNNPMMKFAQNMMGIDVKESNRTNQDRKRKEQVKDRLRKKIERRKSEQSKIEEEESDPDEYSDDAKRNIRSLF